MPNNHKEYDEEPVAYCSRCYSLKIKHEETTDTDCCMDCGCTEVQEADITEWERLYERRYGHKYAEKSEDPRRSKYFRMSVSSLRSEMFHGRLLPWVVKRLYPQFPKNLSRFDTVLLLFERLVKDNRMDDLRYLLYENDNNK